MIRRVVNHILDAAFNAVAVRFLAAIEIEEQPLDNDDWLDAYTDEQLVTGADRLRAAMAEDTPAYNATCAHLAHAEAARDLTDQRLAEYLRDWGTE